MYGSVSSAPTMSEAAPQAAPATAEVSAAATGAPADAHAQQALLQLVAERTAELERTAASLALSEARLRGIFESATDAIVTVDETQTIVVANPAAARLFGYEAAGLTGRPLEQLIPQRFRARHQQDLHRFGSAAVSSRRMGGARDVTGLRADGSEFPIDAAISHLEASGQHLYTVILRDISERRRAEQALLAGKAKLEAAHADLRRLIASQDEVQAEERRRIARELHDDLQQSLAVIRMDLLALREQVPGAPPGFDEAVQRIDAVVGATLTSTRRIVSDLRPLALEGHDFAEALEDLAEQFGRRTGIACTLQACEAALQRVPPGSALASGLYRIIQESLGNVAKHSAAQAVRIGLALEPPRGLTLEVHDNGRGLPAGGVRGPQSFGIVGMQERARALGGVLQVGSAPGGGTLVQVELPLPGDAP